MERAKLRLLVDALGHCLEATNRAREIKATLRDCLSEEEKVKGNFYTAWVGQQPYIMEKVDYRRRLVDLLGEAAVGQWEDRQRSRWGGHYGTAGVYVTRNSDGSPVLSRE
jgi:hypothetical protein